MKNILLLALIHGLLCCEGRAALTLSPKFEALFVFGDSLDATSGGPYWQGRWSNGPMWPELLSTNLGLPYRASNNRAAGGATSAQILSQVRSLAAPANAASALFVVDVGHQDFLGKSDYLSFSNALRTATLNLSNSVVECSRKGARAILLLGMWDPNRSPRLARLTTDPVLFRARTQEINTTLMTMAGQLSESDPDLRLWWLDLFPIFDAMVLHSDHFGFARTDLGALEDPELIDKSYEGPGQEYMFWDSSHLTAKGHALLAQLLVAALRGGALGIRQESDGFRLAFDSLQIGKTYHVQQSGDLANWEDLTSVYALDPSAELVVSPSPPRRFYRLFCQ
jgi:phospholipase/lecithinase/hemolysin